MGHDLEFSGGEAGVRVWELGVCGHTGQQPGLLSPPGEGAVCSGIIPSPRFGLWELIAQAVLKADSWSLAGSVQCSSL